MKVSVLRLGHRFSRDKRISTHLGLVSRALGADELIMDVHDPHVEDSINQVTDEWGGSFNIKTTTNYKRVIENFSGDSVHLTMYGLNINEMKEAIDPSEDKLIVLGGQKVPAEVYDLVDYNIAIGNQPHSEVAALAVYLDRLYSGKELEWEFDGRKKIVPQESGKKLIED